MTVSAAALSDPKILKEITRRIVVLANPRRVVLFGSAARGEIKKGSDYDVLVVVSGPVHRRQLAQKIYRGLHGIGAPVDIVVVTEQDLARYGSRTGTILKPALAEGQVLYEA